jgi:hypothetical protein
MTLSEEDIGRAVSIVERLIDRRFERISFILPVK